MINEMSRPTDDGTNHCEYLTLVFSPLSVPLRDRWRNNGLSADFLGDYVTTFLPGNVPAGHVAPGNQIRHAVVYIVNEFLENAMKYHLHANESPIGIHLILTREWIKVIASNSVSIEQARVYRTFLDSTVGEDPQVLLVKQLEENAKPGRVSSCLGLLTMMTDYGVALSWCFEDCDGAPQALKVTTTAVLPLKAKVEE